MRVVVLADTHAPRRWRACPPRVAAHLRGADLILHAGDVCTAPVLTELSEYAPVVAVLGNNDQPDVAAWGAAETAALDLDGLSVAMVHRGAEATLTGADLAGLATRPGDAAGLSGYGLVHPSNRGALLGWLARLPAAATVVFDPGPLVTSIPPDALDQVLGRADWLTCNAREAAALTGAARPAAALRALADRLAAHGRPGARVLVRTGPDGCLLSSSPQRTPLAVPGFPVTELDSNGAGDTHTGAFIAALAAGADARQAARRANAAAAILGDPARAGHRPYRH